MQCILERNVIRRRAGCFFAAEPQPILNILQFDLLHPGMVGITRYLRIESVSATVRAMVEGQTEFYRGDVAEVLIRINFSMNFLPIAVNFPQGPFSAERHQAGF
jgi:hypothetical protein